MMILSKLIQALSLIHQHLAPTNPVHELLKIVARREILSLFKSYHDELFLKELIPFGDIIFPYHKMGTIDSLDLFGIDELILFSFYWANRAKYKNVLDLGANIGLHSIILDRCGYNVVAYEPDPMHFKLFKQNLKRNNVQHVSPINAAVSIKSGTADFVRVLGNTTSSHLLGTKVPYGPTESFPVKLVDINDILNHVDLIKMDVEGHEKDILLAIKNEYWEKGDCLVEVGTANNAKAIFEHFTSQDITLFSQKTGWDKVSKLEHMPCSYKDGSLFISLKSEMPWGTVSKSGIILTGFP